MREQRPNYWHVKYFSAGYFSRYTPPRHHSTSRPLMSQTQSLKRRKPGSEAWESPPPSPASRGPGHCCRCLIGRTFSMRMRWSSTYRLARLIPLNNLRQHLGTVTRRRVECFVSPHEGPRPGWGEVPHFSLAGCEHRRHRHHRL